MAKVMGYTFGLDAARQLLRHPTLLLHAPKGYIDVTRHHFELDLTIAREDYRQHPPSVDAEGGLAATIARLQDRCRERVCLPNAYLYGVVRLLRPAKVLETGVNFGFSTAFMLAAMADNDAGELWSLDLPNQEYEAPSRTSVVREPLPGSAEPGFVVPPELRSRWHLELGDTRRLLPDMLERVGMLDIFHHDSEHTPEVMTFEYELAWPRLRSGGLLLSDDVSWNSAFPDFARGTGGDWALGLVEGGVLEKP